MGWRCLEILHCYTNPGPLPSCVSTLPRYRILFPAVKRRQAALPIVNAVSNRLGPPLQLCNCLLISVPTPRLGTITGQSYASCGKVSDLVRAMSQLIHFIHTIIDIQQR